MAEAMTQGAKQKIVVQSVAGGFRFEQGPATRVIPRVVDAWLGAAA